MTEFRVHPDRPASNAIEIISDPRKKNQSLQSWLSSVKVAHRDGNILTTFSKTPIWTVLLALMQNNIHSMPVYDETSEHMLGIVDLLDIFTVAVREMDKAQLVGLQHKTMASVSPKDVPALQRPIGSICNQSRRNPFLPVLSGSPMSMVVHLLGSQGLHRVCITSANPREVLGIVSQSHIVRWVAENAASFTDVFQRTAADCGFVGASVHSCHLNELVLDAFRRLSSTRVSALAVLDQNDRVVGQLTVRDIRALISSDGVNRKVNWGILFGTVQELLALIYGPEEASVEARLEKRTCTADTRLGIIVDNLASIAASSHRIFIVDADQKCIGVVSFRDILRVLAQF